LFIDAMQAIAREVDETAGSWLKTAAALDARFAAREVRPAKESRFLRWRPTA